MEQERLLTYKEVSKILRLQENTLRVWVSKRRIPFIKLGRSVRFTPKMVEEIIKTSTVDAIR